MDTSPEISGDRSYGSLPTSPARQAVPGRQLPTGVNGQVLALLLALLTVGLFTGSVVFHETPFGDAWLREALDCNARFPLELNPNNPNLDQMRQRTLCMDNATNWLVTFELLFVAVAVFMTVGATALAPFWSAWRRKWRRWPAALSATSQRVAALAVAAGHRRPPGLMLGSLSLRDAVTMGLPRRYRIVLPPKLAVSYRSELFDATVRHELAHVRRHDVLVAWSTRPALRITAALLVIPIVTALIDQDASLLPSYLWRAAALLVITTAICASILRVREFEADALSAAGADDREALQRTLEQAAPAAKEVGERYSLRRLRSFHPEPAERQRALLDPYSRAQVSFLEATSMAALVAIALPLIRGLIGDRPSWTNIGTILVPLLGGLVLGTSIGAALWRSAYVGARLGRPLWPARAIGGVFVGSIIGSVISLRAVGPVFGGADQGLANLFTPVLTTAATALVASIAGFAASRSRPTPRAGLRLIVTVLPFCCALLISATLAVAYQGGSKFLLPVLTLAINMPRITLLLAVVATCCWILILGSGDRSVIKTTASVAAAGGVLGVAVLVTYRLLAGRPVGEVEVEQRFYLTVCVLALASLVVTLVLAMLFGRHSFGLGMAAGPSAAALGGLLYVTFNAALGGHLTLFTLLSIVLFPQGLAFLLTLLAALIGWPVIGATGFVRSRQLRTPRPLAS
jgi:Zn-dependent protease with chaperone function